MAMHPIEIEKKEETLQKVQGPSVNGYDKERAETEHNMNESGPSQKKKRSSVPWGMEM